MTASGPLYAKPSFRQAVFLRGMTSGADRENTKRVVDAQNTGETQSSK